MLPLDQVVVNSLRGSHDSGYARGDNAAELIQDPGRGEEDSAKLDFDLAWRLNSLRLMRHENTGELYDLCSTDETQIGERAGIGIELFLRSYKMHAAFLALLTVVHIYPLVDNASGSYLETSANATGATIQSYWILKYCLGNSDQDMINFFGIEVHSYEMQVWVQWFVVVLWLFFIALKSEAQNRRASEYDSKHDTASDYALLVTGLPADTTNHDLITYFEREEFAMAVRGNAEPLKLVKDSIVTSCDVAEIVNVHNEVPWPMNPYSCGS